MYLYRTKKSINLYSYVNTHVHLYEHTKLKNLTKPKSRNIFWLLTGTFNYSQRFTYTTAVTCKVNKVQNTLSRKTVN